MPLTTLDDRTALVVVDLQNGVRTRPAAPHPIDDVIAHTGELATDAMTDLNPDAHHHSVRRIFPLLGETGTTAEITELLAKTRY